MPSAKSLLVLFGVGVVVANAAAACSSDPVGFDEPVEAGPQVSLPEAGPGKVDGSLGGDSSLPPTDAAVDVDVTADAGFDAPQDSAPEAETGPPDAGGDAGATGAPCSPGGGVGKETCGLCGFSTRLCGPSTPGGPNVWQPWGFCQSEVAGGCVPGTMTTESCGKCGTRAKVCQIDCQYAVGACKNEPVGACTPGSLDYQVGLSCPTGGRQRTCDATCTYGMFGPCFTPGEPTLTVIPTVGAKAKGQFNLALANLTPRLGSTCPAASLSGTSTPFQYVIIDNPTANTVTVSVYTGLSTNAGATVLDTVVASYSGSTKPATGPARQACVKGVNDDCDDADGDACLNSWAGLTGDDAITLAPNSKALVYVGAYFATGAGDYQLTARTDTVTP